MSILYSIPNPEVSTIHLPILSESVQNATGYHSPEWDTNDVNFILHHIYSNCHAPGQWLGLILAMKVATLNLQLRKNLHHQYFTYPESFQRL